MSLGAAIRQQRKALHLTLQALADEVGADAGNLSRIERGEQGITEVMLRKLCAALKCSPAFLYAQSEPSQALITSEKIADYAIFNKQPFQTPSAQSLNRPQEFVSWFRSVAPYIHAFGGKTFVIAFGGEVVDDGQFVSLSHDLNLLASLEVRIVLVHGARPQIESRLKRANLETKLAGGLRVTDDAAMEVVKEANGSIRVEIESLLSMGLVNSPMAGSDIRVASGNFVTAKPIGVLEGVDLQHTGEVRKVDGMAIQKRLDDGEMVLLSPLGYSPTGEAFNLSLEDVAVSTAIALDADKLIFLMDSSGVHNARGELLREMTAQKAKNLLQHVKKNQSGNIEADFQETPNITEDEAYYLPAAIRACDHGVARTHLICRHTDGAILQELFTHDGIGTMVTEMPLESMRQAEIDDVGALLQLIEPLEAEGILVRRGRERLEMEIEQFYVMEHDGRVIGCAALYPFAEEKTAEFACLAIHPAYRGGGRGDRLFHYCEAQAKELGFKTIFCLTTRTEHWFLERGFIEKTVTDLPAEKQKIYNLQRRSKVFVKKL
ncbi:amino-acid N-acetyltransferase [Candidatus Methylopumilus turicensis]|uniref:Amino-acid acetyltransferase n=1 Tax=Candidatus Methylopumilus turicensis TaxID=1581680 RepID=A0A0B7J1C6_9PROT|nr:amino-acid N-acetyltransferase [Candidatus Methylopumilus turicensis]CEN56553.1 Amino-acid acetyltransferase [Candidatus Methylopumilus turicensis]